MRNVSIVSAVEDGVQELSCERVSGSSLRLEWGEVAEGSDSVVGYRVEVQEIQHRPNSRELVAVSLSEEYDRIIEQTSTSVTQGLGKMTFHTTNNIFMHLLSYLLFFSTLRALQCECDSSELCWL